MKNHKRCCWYQRGALTNTWTITYIALLTTILILNYTFRREVSGANLCGIARRNRWWNQVTKYKILPLEQLLQVSAERFRHNSGAVTPSDFTFMKSIEVLIIVVFGGIGSFTGSFVAAITLNHQPCPTTIWTITYDHLCGSANLNHDFPSRWLFGTWEFKLETWSFSRRKKQRRVGSNAIRS